MPKAYWIAHVSPNDETSTQSDAYKAYVAGAGPAFATHDAKFLARGGEYEQLEGDDAGSRHVVIEFPSLKAAHACYHCAVYTEAKKHRMAVASATIILVEGIESV